MIIKITSKPNFDTTVIPSIINKTLSDHTKTINYWLRRIIPQLIADEIMGGK